LHQLFSTNSYGWFRWVFDHLVLPKQACILEIACGRGDLWAENMPRIPAGWEITLTDASPGMVASTRARLSTAPRLFHFQQADIENIPFEAEQFDGVIANHMLYYVDDKPRALREVLRVLKPEGTFYATTVGAKHMHELVELMSQYLPAEQAYDMDSSKLDFLLENGAAQLSPFFERVEMHRYEDFLFITDADRLVQYVLWGELRKQFSGAEDEFHGFIEQKMRGEGGIFVYKDSGIFRARKGG
jgi:ubiquinone/menaquinone biosynthesis C-methylase UbiE